MTSEKQTAQDQTRSTGNNLKLKNIIYLNKRKNMNYEIIPAEKFDLSWLNNYDTYLNILDDKKNLLKYIQKDHNSIVSFMYGPKITALGRDGKVYYTCKAHIFKDDHCYIVATFGGTYIDTDGKEKEYYVPTHRIFPEALEVLKTLQTPT